MGDNQRFTSLWLKLKALRERSTHLRSDSGGGSLTSLPVVETEAQNISAYIPTNIISITDGQIYLSPDLFQKGILPAVDVGKSVSRVGGKAQLSAYRKVAAALRLSYSQFQELESFARFGTRLDQKTRQTLAHGKRVREVLKQLQFSPLAAGEQIAILLAVNEGLLDDIPIEKIQESQDLIVDGIRSVEGLVENVSKAGKDDSVWEQLLKVIKASLEKVTLENHAEPGRDTKEDQDSP